MKTKKFAAAAAALVLTACASAPVEPLRATVQLKPTRGSKTFGEATFEQAGAKVHVLVNVRGLKAGQEHGFHIHEVGDCSSGDGLSAKGHFNPFGKAHGRADAAEHHAGDLPSLKGSVGKGKAAGHGKMDVMLEGITLESGPASIVGRGLIIHADPDDHRTQPTGNAGARIACGVIKLD